MSAASAPKNRPLTRPLPQKRDALASELRALAQALAPGARMPSVPELMRERGVAKTTAENAVALLTREGLVVRRRGSGTFVAPANDAVRVPGRGSDTDATPRTTARNTLAVFAFFRNEFYTHFLNLLIREAETCGLAVECRYVNHALTRDDVIQFEALRPQAYVVIGYDGFWMAEVAQERGHRTVLLGEPRAGVAATVPVIHADAEAGGYLAARRLLDLGHRRIAYLTRLPFEDLRPSLRWRGHVRALHEAGIENADDLPKIDNDTLELWKREPDAAGRYFGKPNAPTGVVVWNDSYAVPLVGALLRAGLRVPDDVSVVGYDNLPSGEHCYPALDTVDQGLEAQVRHALDLLALPDQAEPKVHVVVPPILIARASCAPPAFRS